MISVRMGMSISTTVTGTQGINYYIAISEDESVLSLVKMIHN